MSENNVTSIIKSNTISLFKTRYRFYIIIDDNCHEIIESEYNKFLFLLTELQEDLKLALNLKP